MAIPFFDRRNMDFVLNELLNVEQLTERNYYQEHSRETFDAIIEVAEQIATEHFHSHNAESDKNEPVMVDGQVKIIPEVKEAIQVFAEAGFFAGHHSEELGGIQLPWVVNQACSAIFQAANAATVAYPFLTIAAANVIEAFGSEEQKARYLPAMLDGRCFGTMALTETQAGSSLADITTSAEYTAEGHYLIRGTRCLSPAASTNCRRISSTWSWRASRGRRPGSREFPCFWCRATTSIPMAASANITT